LKISSNFGLSKIHNYHLTNVIKKKITINFIISLFKEKLIIINNLDRNLRGFFQIISNLINELVHFLNFKSSVLTINIYFKKQFYKCVHNHHINVLPISNWKIQNYIIHHKHLNTLHLIEMTIVTPKMSHSTMHSRFIVWHIDVV
jgi:hypothetical protein